ncbi:MAG: winged helix-turn-helix transcriptional regulator [Candidatus Aenigmarchaeota archaeon]|nr:winged helix-turn-helix transcriptional regulator [Candidatus Aenigmarchaeota archaeon]
MITDNEKKILRFLLANFNKDYSINELAKSCGLSPNGAYEILKKFEKTGVVLPKNIANLKSYKIDFKNIEANKLRHNDLKPLERITKLCVIFGSYITKKENPNDIDILFVLQKKDYKKYTQLLDRVRMTMPYKLHDIVQTKEDLDKNIRKGDKIVIETISRGIVLWGHDFFIKVIKNVAER